MEEHEDIHWTRTYCIIGTVHAGRPAYSERQSRSDYSGVRNRLDVGPLYASP